MTKILSINIAAFHRDEALFNFENYSYKEKHFYRRKGQKGWQTKVTDWLYSLAVKLNDKTMKIFEKVSSCEVGYLAPDTSDAPYT